MKLSILIASFAVVFATQSRAGGVICPETACPRLDQVAVDGYVCLPVSLDTETCGCNIKCQPIPKPHPIPGPIFPEPIKPITPVHLPVGTPVAPQ